jgi:HD-GYP domain-containing protein (c-di-GMP phosphodiesterase class II)
MGSPVVGFGAAAATLGLLLLVCVRQAQLYRLSRAPTLAGFLVSAIFLFQAQLSMALAPAWHASWWEYHGLMLAGFGAALCGLVLEYSQGGTLAGVVEGLLVRDTIRQLQRGYDEVIIALVEAVEAKDSYTRGHTQRVAELAIRIGVNLGLSPERLRTLHRSAMLHDIGKIGVPDAILNKPGRLTPDEFAVIQEHPVRGHLIVRGVRSLRGELAGIRSHHERLDGSGYPDGLTGAAIPLEARIIAVADVFDALTSARAYRSAMPPERAIEMIDREAGAKLDPACVSALHRVIAQGLPAESGDTGRVAEPVG